MKTSGNLGFAGTGTRGDAVKSVKSVKAASVAQLTQKAKTLQRMLDGSTYNEARAVALIMGMIREIKAFRPAGGAALAAYKGAGMALGALLIGIKNGDAENTDYWFDELFSGLRGMG